MCSTPGETVQTETLILSRSGFEFNQTEELKQDDTDGDILKDYRRLHSFKVRFGF